MEITTMTVIASSSDEEVDIDVLVLRRIPADVLSLFNLSPYVKIDSGTVRRRQKNAKPPKLRRQRLFYNEVSFTLPSTIRKTMNIKVFSSGRLHITGCKCTDDIAYAQRQIQALIQHVANLHTTVAVKRYQHLPDHHIDDLGLIYNGTRLVGRVLNKEYVVYNRKKQTVRQLKSSGEPVNDDHVQIALRCAGPIDWKWSHRVVCINSLLKTGVQVDRRALADFLRQNRDLNVRLEVDIYPNVHVEIKPDSRGVAVDGTIAIASTGTVNAFGFKVESLARMYSALFAKIVINKLYL